MGYHGEVVCHLSRVQIIAFVQDKFAFSITFEHILQIPLS